MSSTSPLPRVQSTLVLRRAFIGATMTWTIALPLATWIASRPQTSSVLYMAALAVYGAGSVVCHQLPDRSFHVWSAQMPVCARCTGIYAGAAIAAALVQAGRGGAIKSGARSVPATVRLRLAIAALPTLATLVFEWSTGHVPSNATRALAGIPLGAALAWTIAAALAELREVN